MVRTRRFNFKVWVLAVLLPIAFYMAISPPAAQSQTPSGQAITTVSGEEATLSGELDELAFVAGGRVLIGANSTDDVYAAAGNMTLRRARAEGMFLVGGEIIATDIETGDLTVAGGQAQFISGLVSDDLVAAGGQLTLAPDFRVEGAAVLAGGEVRVEAPIGGELRAGGGVVELNATVGGDVSLAGDRVILGPAARIGGSLTYRAGRVEIDPAAVISGETRVLEPYEDAPLRARDVVLGALFAVMGGLIALLLLAWAAGLLLPGLMRDADQMIRTKPWMTLAIGFLVGLVAPAVLLFLVVTIVGIPVAVTVGALLVAAAPLAIAGFLHFAGHMIRRLLGRDSGERPGFAARAGWTALGVVALVVVGFIPFIGAIAWTVAYVTGLGAVATRGAQSLARGLEGERDVGEPIAGL